MQFKCKIIALFILTASVSLAGPQQIQIINGRKVQPGESYARHTVGIGNREGLLCTAVIIDKNFLLTAAHCRSDVEQAGIVFFGMNPTGFEQRKVVKVFENPGYCRQGDCGQLGSVDDRDILIVQFGGALPVGFLPVQIAPQALLTKGQTIHIAGFGLSEKQKYDDQLKVAKVPFAKLNGESEFITDESRAGSCTGDSGGPAYIEKDGQLLLAGLTSRGDGACRRMGIYTMVDFFVPWIQGIINARF